MEINGRNFLKVLVNNKDGEKKKNEGIWFYFYNDELEKLTIRQMIDEMAKISNVSDPRRYHVRDVNGERVAIALYGSSETDNHFESLDQWSSNLDSMFGNGDYDDEDFDWEDD